MALEVTVTTKVPGTEDVYQAKGSLVIEGEDKGTANVLVQNLGEGKAKLVLNPAIGATNIAGATPTSYRVNGEVADVVTEYEGNFKKGTVLEFKGFSFTHKQ